MAVKKLEVRITGSARGGTRALGDLGRAAGEADQDLRRIGDDLNGRDIGGDLGRDIGSGLDDGFDPFRIGGDLGEDLGRGLDDGLGDVGAGLGDDVGGGMAGGLGGKKAAIMGALSSIGVGLVASAGAIALAAGAALGVGLVDHFEEEASHAKLTAQLDLNPAESAAAAEASTAVFRDGWGETLDEVNGAVGGVISTLGGLDSLGADGVESLTKAGLVLAEVMDLDVSRAISSTGILLSSGLVDDAEHGMDLIGAAMQKMPSHMREELLEASDEYGKFFAQLGYTGEQAFSLLTTASEDGMYGIDKLGDAMKEFTLLATEVDNPAVREHLQGMGLDADKMADQLLAGGDQAAEAMGAIANGLLDIENDGARAAASVALFGTPLEDLGKSGIPDFLAGLTEVGEGLTGVEGTVDDMAVAVDGNARGWESWKRRAKGALGDFSGKYLGPAAEQALGFAGSLRDAFNEGGMEGAVEHLGDAWDRGWPVVKEKASALWGRLGTWMRSEGPGLLSRGGALADRFWDWLQDAYPGFARQMAGVWGRVINWFSETGVPRLAGWLRETAGPAVWQWVQDAYPSAVRAMAGLWGGLIAWLAETGVPWMVEQSGRMRAALTEWVITDAAPALLRGLGSMRDKVRDWFDQTAIPWLRDKAGELWDKLREAAEKKGEDVLAWAEGLPEQIREKLGDLGGTLLQSGKDLVAGFVDGIDEKIPDLETIIRGLGDMVPDWVKKVLGINSPSRVMAEVGRHTVDGLVLGVDSQQGALADALRRIAAEASDLTLTPDVSIEPNGGRGVWGQSGTTGEWSFTPVGTVLEDGSVVTDHTVDNALYPGTRGAPRPAPQMVYAPTINGSALQERRAAERMGRRWLDSAAMAVTGG